MPKDAAALRRRQIERMLCARETIPADDLPETTALASLALSSAGLMERSKVLDLPYKIYLPGIEKMRLTFGRLNVYQALIASISGQKFASVDSCSSEPNCVPGCGVEVVLVGETTMVEDLHLLRTFRDHVLAHSLIGLHFMNVIASISSKR